MIYSAWFPQILCLLISLMLSPLTQGFAPLPWHHEQQLCLATAFLNSLNSPSINRKISSEDSPPDQSILEKIKVSLCEEPSTSCDLLRENHAISSPFLDHECTLNPYYIKRFLTHLAFDSQLIQTLKLRNNSTNPALGVFKDPQWQKFVAIFDETKIAIAKAYQSLNPKIAPILLNKIRNAKLFDPYDTSFTSEERERNMKSCGINENYDLMTSPLGVANATATIEGTIIICPIFILQFETLEEIALLILHELAHLLSPCLIGTTLAHQRKGEDCQIDVHDIHTQSLLNWRSDLKSYEACFHDAGINPGADIPPWIIPTLERSQQSRPQTCATNLKDHLNTEEIEQGLLSNCNKMGIYVGAILQNSLRNFEENLSEKEKQEINDRDQQLLNIAQNPNDNQFDESWADIIASLALSHFLENHNGHRDLRTDLQLARGLIIFCALDATDTGESHHPNGNKRMEILSTPLEIQKRLSCNLQNSRKLQLSKNLDQCLN